jgi:hypothetical protein
MVNSERQQGCYEFAGTSFLKFKKLFDLIDPSFPHDI